MLDSLPVRVKLVGVSAYAVPVVSGPVAIVDRVGVADHEEAADPGVLRDALPPAQQFPFIHCASSCVYTATSQCGTAA